MCWSKLAARIIGRPYPLHFTPMSRTSLYPMCPFSIWTLRIATWWRRWVLVRWSRLVLRKLASTLATRANRTNSTCWLTASASAWMTQTMAMCKHRYPQQSSRTSLRMSSSWKVKQSLSVTAFKPSTTYASRMVAWLWVLGALLTLRTALSHAHYLQMSISTIACKSH